jgi:hypothetical protein
MMKNTKQLKVLFKDSKKNLTTKRIINRSFIKDHLVAGKVKYQ